MRLILATLLAISACATTDPAAEDSGGDAGGKADSATEARVFERARDLAVEVGLVFEEGREYLDVELEDSPVNYRSAQTLDTRVATLYWVKVTIDTLESHDFIRVAVVDVRNQATLDAVLVQPYDPPAAGERRTLEAVDSYARDLGVELVLAVDETRDNLDVTFERRLAHYQSLGTANTRIATAHFVQVAMDTGQSYDFARFIVIDSARLPALVSVLVQDAVE